MFAVGNFRESLQSCCFAKKKFAFLTSNLSSFRAKYRRGHVYENIRDKKISRIRLNTRNSRKFSTANINRYTVDSTKYKFHYYGINEDRINFQTECLQHGQKPH